MSDSDNAKTILEAGAKLAGAEPRVMWLGNHNDPSVMVPVALVTTDGCGRIAVIGDALTELDKRAGGPLRRTGIVKLTEVDSFISFIGRWGGEATVVYADTAALGFVAVLNDHPVGDGNGITAWRDHRVEYACPRSPEWIAWTAVDGEAMRQTEFADFIESRLEDIVQPTSEDGGINHIFPRPLELLEMSRNLHIHTKGTFQRTVDPTTGSYTLINKSEHEVGSTVIPRAFAIAIPVFEGGSRYELEARIRFVLGEAGPAFSFALHRRVEIERVAFGAVRDQVGKETARQVLAGKP